jgi:hypothetical protein
MEGQGGQQDVIVRRDQGERSSNTNRAREYWIDRNAFEKFRMPFESLQHPAIRQYVGLSNDTCCLRENAGAAARNMLWHGTENNARRLAEAEASGNTGSWEEIRASYPMRLLRAREITEEATQCFEIGFGGFLLPYKIQAAVEPYGCTARGDTERVNNEIPQVTPGSVWRNQEGVEETREFIPSGETPPGNYLWRNHQRLAPIPRFEELAQRLGIPRSYWADPETRQYISLMSDSEAILTALRAGEQAPGAPGLTPSVTDRYRATAGLLQFTVAMLQEGFQGNTVTPDFVQETLAPLAPFGIEVVKVPPSQKLLSQGNTP